MPAKPKAPKARTKSADMIVGDDAPKPAIPETDFATGDVEVREFLSLLVRLIESGQIDEWALQALLVSLTDGSVNGYAQANGEPKSLAPDSALIFNRAISYGRFDPVETRLLRFCVERAHPHESEDSVCAAVRILAFPLAASWRVSPHDVAAALLRLLDDQVLAILVDVDEFALCKPTAWSTSRLDPADLALAFQGEPSA